MRKNIKLLAIMFAFAMQSVTMWSATTSMYPVSLSYRQGPLLGNNPKPSKAPAHFCIPLSVVLDEDSQQLLVTALAEGEFTYNIYNETGNLISEGILNCNCNDSQNIDLGLYYSGVYYLVVTYNGHTFGGSFEIYE